MLKKYAFLDRDGTLIYEPTPEETKEGDIPYQIDSLEKLKILDGVIEGLQKLQKSAYKLVMVSNQDALGTDIFPQESFDIPHNQMLKIFQENGIEFVEVLICTHKDEDNCKCRKPKTELIDMFLNKQNSDWDKENSFICGDSPCDKKLAENLGLRFVAMETNSDFGEVIDTFIE